MTRERFGAFDYETTLAYFRYTMRDPEHENELGEKRRDWFERNHEISTEDFAALVLEREREAKRGRNLADKNRANLARRRRGK